MSTNTHDTEAVYTHAGLAWALDIDETRLAELARRGEYIAIPDETGENTYPTWQFDDHLHVHPGLAQAWRAAGMSTDPATRAAELLTELPSLKGRSIAVHLAEGHSIPAGVDAARGIHP